MAGLPKKYAKMGFKKGWRLFKANKRGSARVKTKSRSVKPMAKKRYAKAKKYYKKAKSAVLGKVGQLILGAGLAVGFENYVSPLLPLNGMIKNLIEIVIGAVCIAVRFGGRMSTSFGIALVTINAYQILNELLANGFSLSPGDPVY